MSKYLMQVLSRMWNPGLDACLLSLRWAVAMREGRRHE